MPWPWFLTCSFSGCIQECSYRLPYTNKNCSALALVLALPTAHFACGVSFMPRNKNDGPVPHKTSEVGPTDADACISFMIACGVTFLPRKKVLFLTKHPKLDRRTPTRINCVLLPKPIATLVLSRNKSRGMPNLHLKSWLYL